MMMTFVATAGATEFYIDPELGSSENNGSAKKPWKSLQDIVDKGLIETRTWTTLPYKDDSKLVEKNKGAAIKAGDTIWLRNGYYGDLNLRGFYNSDFITIAAAKGHKPKFHSVRLQAGSHWKLKGLNVSAEFDKKKKPTKLINIESHGFHGPISDVVIENCILTSAADTSSWSAEDWNKLSCNGIGADGTRITLRNNNLKNVNFGISVSATHSLIESNIVENFAGDGLRGLGDHCTFQYNVIKNCYDVNENHDDGFQSWSRTKDGVGKGEVKGIVLRGNTIINYEDPNQPHRGPLQGIGCFDGMFTDWVVENNLIVVDHWHGLTLLGARNCRIINNTVLDINNERPGPAWILIDKHKNGTLSENCIIRNNLAASIKGKGLTIDHNLIVKDPESIFQDPSHNDFRLKKGSPAIDTGSNDSAPEKDIIGTSRPKGKSVDIGAYEYTEK